MPRRLIMLPMVAFVAVTIVPVSARAAPAAEAGLEWQECSRRFECATLEVPVDYGDPDGPTVALSVTRRPADQPADRLGTLFINFGGPGVPSAETLRDAVPTFPPFMRERFDLISFDPRGTGSSRPVDCVDDATFRRYLSEDPTPDSPADLPSFYDGTASSVDLVAACIERQGPWLAHVGTRNVARDIDRLRIALGERRINFLGYSYGTVLGAVYAQEFPRRVRTMVLDSVVNLSVSRATELGQTAKGFEHALDTFLDDCARDSECAFAAGADPRSELLRLRDEFEAGKTVTTVDKATVGVSEFYVSLIASLYSPQFWPILAEALQSATRGDGTLLQELTNAYVGERPDGTYNNIQEAISVIICDDVPEPKVSFEDYRVTHEELVRKYPFFGPLLGSVPLGCDPRLPAPSRSEVLGDVRAADAPPILVVGVTGDPATPYAGAKDLTARIARSRLLTVTGTQHGGFAQGSPCVDAAVERYFLTRRLPARSARCTT